MRGRIDGPPEQVVELTQKIAQRIAEASLYSQEQAILAIDVYRVKFSEDPL